MANDSIHNATIEISIRLENMNQKQFNKLIKALDINIKDQQINTENFVDFVSFDKRPLHVSSYSNKRERLGSISNDGGIEINNHIITIIG